MRISLAGPRCPITSQNRPKNCGGSRPTDPLGEALHSVVLDSCPTISMAPLTAGTTAAGMEWSIHACPARFRQEVGSVLHGVDLDKLLIVPTCQHAAVDLVKVGDTVEAEKDLLLERFMDWAKPLCEVMIAQGFWADYIDPCSGLPMIHQQGQTVYPEVEALSVLMGYQTSNAGCCKVLLHPKWGSAVYPATMFTTAPLDTLVSAIQAADTTITSTA